MSNLFLTFEFFGIFFFPAMRKADAKKYFDTYEAIAQALEISRSAVSQWPEVVPQGAAWRLQFITGGRLRVDPTLYSRRKHPRKEVAQV